MTFGTLTTHGETQIITFDRTLPHPRSAVWSAITDPDKRAEWFFAGTLPLTPGEGVDLVDSESGVTGVVRDVAEGELLEFTWVSHDGPDSIVRFELSDTANGDTRLVFTHTVTTGNVENLMPGWHRILLDDLPEFLQTGKVSAKPGRWAELREEHYLPLVTG